MEYFLGQIVFVSHIVGHKSQLGITSDTLGITRLSVNFKF